MLEAITEPDTRDYDKIALKNVAARKFGEDLIRQYLKLEVPMIRQTTIFSELLDQSRLEGELKGELKGKNALLIKQLERKFGRLPQSHKSALIELNSEQLDDLALEVLDLNDLDSLQIWLAKVQTKLVAA